MCYNKKMIIKVTKKTKTTPRELKKIIQIIKNHPQKYKFNTHKGIHPIDKPWYKENSQFYTIERFFLFYIKLHFKVLKFTQNQIKFKLLKPISKIYLNIQINKQVVLITIKSNLPKLIETLIFNPISNYLIKRQLEKELNFITQKLPDHQ